MVMVAGQREVSSVTIDLIKKHKIVYNSIMKDLLSAREAAKYLGLNLQTVYRKVKRGELNALRFGKTVRICLPDGIGESAHLSPPRPVPEFVHRLLWDLEAGSTLDDSPQVMERVLEYGDLGDVAWLFKVRAQREILEFLKGKGQRRLSPRSRNFWCDYFEVTNEQSNSQSQTTKALGEDRWR